MEAFIYIPPPSLSKFSHCSVLQLSYPAGPGPVFVGLMGVNNSAIHTISEGDNFALTTHVVLLGGTSYPLWGRSKLKYGTVCVAYIDSKYLYIFI